MPVASASLPSSLFSNNPKCSEIIKLLSSKFKCKFDGSFLSQATRAKHFSFTCTCCNGAPIRVERSNGQQQNSNCGNVLVLVGRAAIHSAPTVFYTHYQDLESEPIYEVSMTYLAGKVADCIAREDTRPSHFQVLNYLMLLNDRRLAQTLATMDDNALSVFVNDRLLEHDASLAETMMNRLDSDGLGGGVTTVTGLSVLMRKFSIRPHYGRPPLVAELHHTTSIQDFVEHFGFSSVSQTLTYPVSDWLLEEVDQNFDDASVRVQVFQCVVMLSPSHLWALWKIATSTLYRHLKMYYVDGKFKILRAGTNGTTLLTLGTMVLNVRKRMHKVTRSFVPVCQCLAPSESKVATFVMNTILKDIFLKMFGLVFSVDTFTMDLSLGLINGSLLAHPTSRITFDLEHMRALMISKSWKAKIRSETNRQIIEADFHLLIGCRGDIHQANAMLLALKRWGVGGLNETEFVDFIQTNYVDPDGRFGMGEWNSATIPLCGFSASTSALDRYHSRLKGVELLQRIAGLRFDVGANRFVVEEMARLMVLDASIIAEAPIAKVPPLVESVGVHISYSTLACVLLMGPRDCYDIPPTGDPLEPRRRLMNVASRTGREVVHNHATAYQTNSTVRCVSSLHV
jgi:hypothetical protein